MSYTDLHRSDFAAIEWSLNEIMDNVLVHSESNFGGLVQLTTFNNYNKKIEFIVSDGGNGIPCTLKPHISESTQTFRPLITAFVKVLQMEKAKAMVSLAHITSVVLARVHSS